MMQDRKPQPSTTRKILDKVSYADVVSADKFSTAKFKSIEKRAKQFQAYPPQNQEIEELVEEINQLIAQSQEHLPKLLLMKARMLKLQNNFENAITDLSSSILRSPKHWAAYHELADTYFQMNEFSECIKYCEMIPANTPSSAKSQELRIKAQECMEDLFKEQKNYDFMDDKPPVETVKAAEAAAKAAPSRCNIL